MKQYFEKYPLAFVTAATFLFIVFSNSAIKDPVFDTEEKKISFLQITGQYEAADKAFLKWLDDKPDEMDVHYKYLHNHFRIAEKKKNEKSENVYRDDRSIREYYTLKLTSQKTEEKDIGFYGLGLLDIMQGDYANALLDFDSVSNRNLKYLNNSVGYILMERNRSKEAEEMFQKEIAQNGYVAGAYSNLGRLYYKSGDSKKLGALLANPKAEKYVPVEIREAYYFRAGNMVQYLREILYETTTHINLFGFLAALLIMGSWMMYLRRIDLFDPIKWGYVFFALGGGMFFLFGAYFLTDFINQFLHFDLNGKLLNDFFYCVVGIGAVEELVKIIPLLFLIRFTNAANEPYDYILYASLSALGFAFVENLKYFDEGSLNIIHGRALAATVSHMFDSSIIAYGLILNRYKRKYNRVLNFLFFFLLAALAHGFYDFWIINKTANAFGLMSIFVLTIGVSMWDTFLNNALNNSEFFDENKLLEAPKLRAYLIYSLSAVLLFEYTALSIKYGPRVADNNLFGSIYGGTYLLIFISSGLSRFKLIKGKWLAFMSFNKNQSVTGEK